MEVRMIDIDQDEKIEPTKKRCPICGGRMMVYKGVYRCPDCSSTEDIARRY
jgi:tRNA(Ile2) C34 agmatinyltransferase TiaS